MQDSLDVWRGRAPFAVRLDTVASPRRPDERFDRLVVEHPGAVAVLAVDDQDRVLVLEQYRHPVRMRLVELPAGLLDGHEDPLSTARRELLEEAKLEAASWSHLLGVYTSPGIVGERMEIFLARGLSVEEERGGFVPSHEEADMSTAWVPVLELLERVLSGELSDGPLALAVLAYTARRG